VNDNADYRERFFRKTGKSLFFIFKSQRLNEPELTQAIQDMENGIQQVVNSMLKNTKCCSSVKVTVIYWDNTPITTTYTTPISSYTLPTQPKS
jgi:uncharacterized protein YegL